MLNEIVNRYEHFSDARILELTYRAYDNSKKGIELVIDCMNAFNDYEFEKVKLIFTNVMSFHFHENENNCSTVIDTALITSVNGVIVFDFFPLTYAGDLLKENENSNLKIKCKKVVFQKC